MSAISNRKNIHDPKSTKQPLDSSARLPASHRNHLGKVHGKSEERYIVSTAMSARCLWVLWLATIIESHGLVAKLPPLCLAQLVAPGAKLSRLHSSGRLL